MPWKEVTAVNERMEFVARLKAGERMTDLCREFGISRKTGYKFERRFQEHGDLVGFMTSLDDRKDWRDRFRRGSKQPFWT